MLVHSGLVVMQTCGPKLGLCYTRSPSQDSRLFGPRPCEILAATYGKNGFLSNPEPGEHLVSGNLVMETGCTAVGLGWGLTPANLSYFVAVVFVGVGCWGVSPKATILLYNYLHTCCSIWVCLHSPKVWNTWHQEQNKTLRCTTASADWVEDQITCIF